MSAFYFYYVTCLTISPFVIGRDVSPRGDGFRVPKTKDSTVSITDLHNLARPDNTDNQAPLRYVARRVLDWLVSGSDSTGGGAVKT